MAMAAEMNLLIRTHPLYTQQMRINYDGENGLNAQLKEAALAADAANEPNPDRVDINICLNDKSGNPFDAANLWSGRLQLA